MNQGEEDFLAELHSDQFVPTETPEQRKQATAEAKEAAKEAKRLIAEAEKERKRELKEQKKQERQAPTFRLPQEIPTAGDDCDSLFGGEATPIHGRDKLLLMKKVRQYRQLFPEELKGFKIKRNPSPEDLELALQEMESLVETGGVDGFLMDSVLQCIRVIEGVSTNTKYDVRGCVDLLKANKQCHSLCKQLFIKYNVFSAVAPEYQLILLVSTTAYIANQKNRNKASLNSYLDQPVNENNVV